MTEKSKKNALNDIYSYCSRVVGSGTPKAELLSNVSTALIQIAMATAELRQACNTISTQSKWLVKIVQLQISIKSLKDSVSCDKANEENLKSKLAAKIMESIRFDQFWDDAREEVVYLRKILAAKNADIRSIIEDSIHS